MFAMSDLELNKEQEAVDNLRRDEDEDKYLLHRQSTIGDFTARRKEYPLKKNYGLLNLGEAQFVCTDSKSGPLTGRSREEQRLVLDFTAITPLNDLAVVHLDPDDWSLDPCARTPSDDQRAVLGQVREEEERESLTNIDVHYAFIHHSDQSDSSSPSKKSNDLMPYLSHYKPLG